MNPMRRLALLAPIALLALVPVSPASAAGCKLSSREQNGSLGATYVTKLTVSGTSCATGKRVVRSFNACRKAAGGAKGRCSKRVRGLRCSESRTAIPTQFNSKATCRSSSVVVRFTYTQFT
jgi:hypothetical protein